MRELRPRKEKLTAKGMQTRPRQCAALSEAMLDGKRKTNRPRKDRKQGPKVTQLLDAEARPGCSASVSPGFRSLCPLPCLSTKSLSGLLFLGWATQPLTGSFPPQCPYRAGSHLSCHVPLTHWSSRQDQFCPYMVSNLQGKKAKQNQPTNQINNPSERPCSTCTPVSLSVHPQTKLALLGLQTQA